MKTSLKEKIKFELKDYSLLLKNVPFITMCIFVVSTIALNLFTSKELMNLPYLALDCGILLSWISFLCMDMLTKRFGAKAAVKLTIVSMLFNLGWCAISYLITHIGLNWSAFYTYEQDVANDAVNETLGGTWYILMASTLALIVASIVNATINQAVGKLFKKDNFGAYAVRSYVSTFIAQFCDNMVFASIAFHVFFGWTWIQVLIYSILLACLEVLMEIIFSPIGYKVCKRWERKGMGSEYLEFVESCRTANPD